MRLPMAVAFRPNGPEVLAILYHSTISVVLYKIVWSRCWLTELAALRCPGGKGGFCQESSGVMLFDCELKSVCFQLYDQFDLESSTRSLEGRRRQAQRLCRENFPFTRSCGQHSILAGVHPESARDSSWQGGGACIVHESAWQIESANCQCTL